MKPDLSDISDADVKKIINQITWCEVCGDGIGTQNYSEHLDCCKRRVFTWLGQQVQIIIDKYDSLPVYKEIAGKGIISKLNEVKKEFEVMTK